MTRSQSNYWQLGHYWANWFFKVEVIWFPTQIQQQIQQLNRIQAEIQKGNSILLLLTWKMGIDVVFAAFWMKRCMRSLKRNVQVCKREKKTFKFLKQFSLILHTGNMYTDTILDSRVLPGSVKSGNVTGRFNQFNQWCLFH